MPSPITVGIRLCPKEKGLLTQLNQTLGAFNSASVSIEVKSDEAVATGDIIISPPEGSTYRKLVLERKTASDLLSSVKSDKRYVQQTARMVQLQRNGEAYCGYVAEYDRNKISITDREAIEHQIATSIVLKHHLQWWQTSGERETANLLVALAKKIAKLNHHQEPDDECLALRGACHEKRKGLLRMSAFFPVMLQVIDGVSERRALAIVQKYTSLKTLMNAYAIATDPANLLTDILVPGSKEGKGRKLGATLSARIHQVLYKEQDVE